MIRLHLCSSAAVFLIVLCASAQGPQLDYSKFLHTSQRHSSLACNSCHTGDAQARGPNLQGLFGRSVALEGGGTTVADESYIRESVLDPRAKIAAGYQPIMPTYEGLVTEEQLLALVAYLKSLARPTP